MKKYFYKIVHHPIATLLIMLVVLAPLFMAASGVQTENNIDYVTVEDNEAITFYKSFEKLFGTEELFVVVFEKPDIFEPQWLGVIQSLTEELESWDAVDNLYSLTNVDDIVGFPDYFVVDKFLEDIPEQGPALASKKAAALANPIYRDILVSKDGRTAAIVVEPVLEDVPHDFRIALMAKVESLLDTYKANHDISFYIAGQTFINLRLGETLVKDVKKFIIISYIAMIIIAALIFANLRMALLSFLNIMLTLTCTFGFMAIAGIAMNNFTSLAPAIIMALSLAAAIHVFSHYKHHQKYMDPKSALIESLAETYKPSLFTVVTTGIGFASLAISHIPPIREFGIIAAVGITFIFLITFIVLPACMTLVIRKPLKAKNDLHNRMRKWLESLGHFVRKNARPLFWAHLIVAIVALALIPRIPIETNLVDWFKVGTDVRTNNTFVDEHLAPISSFAISLEGPEDVFKHPEHLQYIEKVQKYSATVPGVRKTLSFVDFIKDMNQSFHSEDKAFYRIPETRELVAQYLILYNSEDVEEYINSDYSHARILIRSIHHGSLALAKQVETIRGFLEANPAPEGLNVRVTGAGAELIEISNEVVSSQIITLVLTIVSISVLLFLVFLSWRLGFISLIPNLYPVIINFGIMGLFKIPLNTGTALISATVFGIVVDDTIHLLYHYQKERKNGATIQDAVHRAMVVKGTAVMTTSMILFCGFVVAVMGTMMPTIQFGILTSIIMVTALFGDLLLLPAVLNLKKST